MRFSIYSFIYLLIGIFAYLLIPPLAEAGPTSTNYELKDFTFGGGGTQKSDSTNYSIFGVAGETEFGKPGSANYKAGAGLIYTMQANVPPAPTWTNPASNYDRLKIVINTGSNPSDALYAVAISDDSFVTAQYVKSDFTIGSTLALTDWLPYSTGVTNWGGATGKFIRTLKTGTTYQVKMAAKRGNFTETGYGPTASATTSNPSLTFGISSSTLTFANLNSANSYTDSAKTTVLTTSTNAYNGYTAYGHETAPLTSGANTIADFASPNSAPTVWSGTGFGYTTDDNNLAGGTADRFTNGGPKHAGFTISAPGDPVADHTAVVEDPTVTNEQFTITYRVTAASTTPAGPYINTVNYVIVPVY